MSAGAHVAAAHAEQQRKEQQEEEEAMTRYNRDELEGDWEFKIVRSGTGKFKSREIVAQLRAEEAQASWQMVEKFDDKRIRFKRPLSAQRNDAQLPPQIDPYRTTYGISENAMGAIVGITIIVVIAIVISVVVYLENGGF